MRRRQAMYGVVLFYGRGSFASEKITFENLLFMTQFLERNPCVKRDMLVIIFNVLCIMHDRDDINSFDFSYVRNHILY